MNFVNLFLKYKSLRQIAILRTNSQSRNSYFEKILSHFQPPNSPLF
ncbi:hypothetical protein LEP1GSC188_3192 [Leptospira weilii serovar Topaz str. LT2116]|uniref:Uncharacterized protein n=1 Tax=Leptospira weilii serovar Topaz str. LT2116 TaxID=1088540 RepID=M3H5F8_9LEPT|nr:hypothetical protein LEP1GSC188_3192 [Leptospira weilii serovar Topaz str. LT2116]